VADLRWGEDVPADVSDARRRLLDAAEACFAHYGVAKTTVEDVAAKAKVSRATVYRYFDGRDDLLLGVLLREAGRFLGRLDKRLDKERDFATAIVDGVLFTISAVRADRHLALLFAPEAAGITSEIAGASDALFKANAEFLRPRLEAAREAGALRAGLDLDEAAEWVLRTILSLLTIKGPVARSEAANRRYLLTYLVPALAAEPPLVASRPRRRKAPLTR
jgi:AcrR family transcriptional regulator